MKFCKDCANYVKPRSFVWLTSDIPRCRALRHSADPVTGEAGELYSCDSARMFYDSCGRDAKLFVARESIRRARIGGRMTRAERFANAIIYCLTLAMLAIAYLRWDA